MAILRLAIFVLLFACAPCQDDLDTNWLTDILSTLDGRTSPQLKIGSCTTDDGKTGVCVKKLNCNKTITLIDATTDFTPRERSCHYLEECCPEDLVKPEEVTPVIQLEPGQCGVSRPGGLVLREKTKFADFGEFPWMVALLKRSKNDQSWSNDDFCGGGSLIHPSVVLTVAHKVDEFEAREIKCRAGEWDTQTEKEIYPHQERNVKKIVIHKEYFRILVHYNVALLILSEPFDMTPHVGVACLSNSLPPAGTECYSMGWGADFKSRKKYAVVLKKIPLPLVSAKQCEISLRNTRVGSTYTLHNTLMCAGGVSDDDTCIGDGGSSLVCPIENTNNGLTRYTVVGMVAYGVGCGVKNVPGVYVNVPQLYQWIVEQMVLEGFPGNGFVY